MIEIRALAEHDLAGAVAIDVSEGGSTVYAMVAGSLEAHDEQWERKRWDDVRWAEMIETRSKTLQPDVWFGALVGELMVGLASLRYCLVDTTAQLTTLHVDRSHRRQGVASRLLTAVVDAAEASGATDLYVSSVPSESAVGFYLRHGFEPTPTPHPALFALEPEDIHMVRPLFRAGGGQSR